MTPAQLEHRIRSGIPLTAHMDFRVQELSDCSISVSGGAAENINVHGTAFAGSLYTVCTLALWGLVNSRLPSDASLVMAEGSIRYRRPVVGDIVAHCQISPPALENFLDSVRSAGKGRLQASVNVAGHDGKEAVEFTATVYARREKSS